MPQGLGKSGEVQAGSGQEMTGRKLNLKEKQKGRLGRGAWISGNRPVDQQILRTHRMVRGEKVALSHSGFSCKRADVFEEIGAW